MSNPIKWPYAVISYPARMGECEVVGLLVAYYPTALRAADACSKEKASTQPVVIKVSSGCEITAMGELICGELPA